MRRIQRSRARGWRMPEGAIYVGRPTRWGNPWRVGDPYSISGAMRGPMVGRYDPNDLRGYDHDPHAGLTVDLVVALYRDNLIDALEHLDPDPLADDAELADLADWIAAFDALRGHDLVCWCALDSPCHADVLLDLANATRPL